MNITQEEFILRESTHNPQSENDNHIQATEQLEDVETIHRDKWQRAPSYTRGISQPLINLVPSSASLNIQEEPNYGANSSCFRDGERSIDFILVWDKFQPKSLDPTNVLKRKVFEENLLNEGLHLERENAVDGLYFIKIHAPSEVLRRYSEILKLRMPMREELCFVHRDQKLNPVLHATMYLSKKIPELKSVHRKTNTLFHKYNTCTRMLMSRFYVDENIFPTKKHRFTAVYSRDKEYFVFVVYSFTVWEYSVYCCLHQPEQNYPFEDSSHVVVCGFDGCGP